MPRRVLLLVPLLQPARAIQGCGCPAPVIRENLEYQISRAMVGSGAVALPPAAAVVPPAHP